MVPCSVCHWAKFKGRCNGLVVYDKLCVWQCTLGEVGCVEPKGDVASFCKHKITYSIFSDYILLMTGVWERTTKQIPSVSPCPTACEFTYYKNSPVNMFPTFVSFMKTSSDLPFPYLLHYAQFLSDQSPYFRIILPTRRLIFLNAMLISCPFQSPLSYMIHVFSRWFRQLVCCFYDEAFWAVLVCYRL